jgi:ABC-type uncharacterized transport system substrate-binding protein
MIRGAVVAGAAMLVLGAAPGFAHPHVFIDYTATILCDGDKVTGVRIAWTFDEMYSASLYHDYTSRPHGPLSPQDVQQLEAGAFEDTAEEHYFTDIAVDGKPQTVSAVKDFDASYDGRRMTYRFTAPLSLAAGVQPTILEVDSFDTEFYIDYELLKHDAIKVENGAALKIVCAPKKASKVTTTFGPLDTQIVACTFQRAA